MPPVYPNNLEFAREFKRNGSDYATFVQLMKEIGYDGYFCYEFCHPALSDTHEPLGIEYIDEQARLAEEFMSTLLRENG
jgi:sugar phosphate isomerase/epimerase